MKEKTVVIIKDGVQMTLDGQISPCDFVGMTLDKEIDEVVDDCLVHVWTVKVDQSDKKKRL